MGLDMYAVVTTAPLPAAVDFKAPDGGEEVLHYWRKHPNLHGWMEALYVQKGGQYEFNFVPVELDLHDLAMLEATILANKLPETVGFFFGVSDGSERDDDLAFVAAARAAIMAGKAVYYTSWW